MLWQTFYKNKKNCEKSIETSHGSQNLKGELSDVRERKPAVPVLHDEVVQAAAQFLENDEVVSPAEEPGAERLLYLDT